MLEGRDAVVFDVSLATTWESISIETESHLKSGTKENAYLTASASTWRGMVMFTFLEPTNTTFPLQSLVTAAMTENLGPTVASTFIFKPCLSGKLQPKADAKTWDLTRGGSSTFMLNKKVENSGCNTFQIYVHVLKYGKVSLLPNNITENGTK